MRLDKYLTECMAASSRSHAKQLIKQKCVRVNHAIVRDAKFSVNETIDIVEVHGEKLVYEQFVYYMLHKPKGVISATKDQVHATVLDLLDEYARKKEVFPVGRLDIDTHGLLLLTNNGELAHALLSPKKHVKKVYEAVIEGIVTSQDQCRFKEGIVLSDGTKCLPALLDILQTSVEKNESFVHITIEEGKFHQVKRMVEAVGKKVTDLKRLSMGPLQLDESLKRGEFRRLTPNEMALFSSLNVPL